MSAAATTAARRRRIFERWFFWPLAFVLLALTFELGHRAQLIVRGRPFIDARAAERIAQIAADNARVRFEYGETSAGKPGSDGELLAHPYLGFATRGALRSLDQALSAMRARDPRVLNVVVLGGGAAHAFATNAGERLASRLGGLPRWSSRKVTVWDFAGPNEKEPQQLEFVLYLTALGARPDVVIDLSGRNELLVGAANALANTNPVYPARSDWERVVHGGATDQDSLDQLVAAWQKQRDIAALVATLDAGAVHCSFWAEDAIEELERLEVERDLALTTYRRRVEATQRELVLAGPTPPAGQQNVAAFCVAAWFQATRDLAALCAARKIRFVAVLEPVVGKPGARDPDERSPTAERLLEGRRALTAAAKPLERLGAICIDSGPLIAAHESTREAAEAIADAIAAKLAAD
jgi:hypothetical protein